FSFSELSEIPQVQLLIVAVAHQEFKNMDLDKILAKVKPGGVILDVKSVLPKDEILARGFVIWRL
ncbi:MAG: hypothetical protein PHC75_07090, partial [Burkholderiales bacterium]|nr:hypothetical protein [Burkholderiales bacterium]